MMRAIVVDDEAIMLKRFARLSADIPDLTLVGQFESPEAAMQFVRSNRVEIAFLDIEMPIMNGIELAKHLRLMRPDILIVFISAYDDYVRDFNQVGGDYYIVKPYNRSTLEMMMERIRLIAQRQQKILYIQTFGRFLVMREGRPIPLTGKAKEILALIVTRRGKEISNEEIFNTVWEGREYSNTSMTVLYNALRRLRTTLQKEGIEDLLISTPRGQIANIKMFDCDYYAWMDNNMDRRDVFYGEFLPEYSWGEFILGRLVDDKE